VSIARQFVDTESVKPASTTHDLTECMKTSNGRKEISYTVPSEPMCRSFVAYYRVSTAKQGASGLGLEAQQSAASAFITSKGADAKLLASYTEVESGKRDDRPQLAKALDHARLTGATLLIAKLDRLSRDAHFLIGLQKAGVAFIAADMPEANALTVGIMALVAQQEREAISRRTREALAAAKTRVAVTGQKKHPEIKRLGCPNGAAHLRQFGGKAGVAAIKANADNRAAGLAATIATIKGEGVMSARGIAKALNERGIVTARGGQWSASTVGDVMARLG
jgi:DNA invertase Pin-like site-specific DNA recombinase